MHGKEDNKRAKKGRSAWNVTLCNDEPANFCFLLLRTLPLNLTLHNFYKGKGQSTHRCFTVRFPQHWSGVFSQMGYTNTNTHLQSALHWGRKNSDGLKSQAGQRCGGCRAYSINKLNLNPSGACGTSSHESSFVALARHLCRPPNHHAGMS